MKDEIGAPATRREYRTRAGKDVVGGRSPKISINGARLEQSSFLLDGTDIDHVYDKTPASVDGVLLGVDAVLEFQVLTNAYSAEFGHVLRNQRSTWLRC